MSICLVDQFVDDRSKNNVNSSLEDTESSDDRVAVTRCYYNSKKYIDSVLLSINVHLIVTFTAKVIKNTIVFDLDINNNKEPKSRDPRDATVL